MASASKASTAAAIEFCFRFSGSIASALLASGGRVLRPIECAFFPDVEESGKDQNHEDQHLHEPEHLQIPVHHNPRVEKDRLDIEQDKQHSHQIEFHAETLPGIARRSDSAFIRGVLNAVAHPLSQ